MDQYYFLVCPVNSQNKVKLSYAFWLMHPTLAQAVDMHRFIRCQIARGIHCSTEHAEYHHCSTSRRGEEPSARFSSTTSTTTRTAWWSVCTLIFLTSDKVHIYSGEGRETAAQHVKMISINHARIYLGLHASPPVCSRSSSLSRNSGLSILPSIEIGLLTLRSHMSVICQEEVHRPTGHTRTWFCTFILLLPPSQFIGCASLWCISLNALPPPETLDVFGLMLN